MKISVLDKSTLGDDIDLSPLFKLGELKVYETTAFEEVAERISDTDIIIVNKIKLNSENLKYAEKLKLICVAATGYDNIDTEFCKQNNIALCNVCGYSTDSVAQVSVAMALSLVSRLNEYRNFVNSGAYTELGIANRITPVYHEISGMVWGVVGGGNIGNRVAEIAEALGCKVLVCRNKREGSFPLADIDTLLKQSDIVSLHIPLNESTKNLINKQRISYMKKNAVLVNTARGAVTDENALAEAVKSKAIGGIGIDVYSCEPFSKEHPFYEIKDYDNVIFTPHMAWGSFESRNRCIKEISENITAFLSGKERNRVV